MPHQVAANPRKKRLVHAARQKRNPPNKKKGSLAKLLKLPLDVVFEILGHMDPGDVLLFARLTKELRGYLMHKSSISVWKKAWSNVPGFPDLPPAMSEPAWANLVFDRHCSACLARRVRLVHWRLRIRLCHLCDHKLVTKMRYRNDGGNPFRDLSWDKQEDWGYLIVTLIPARRTDYQFIYLTKDYQDTQAALLAITDPYAREEFIAECIERHAVLCESWTDDRFQEWIKEHHRIRLARVGAIMVKLMDLGYDIDILDEQNHKKFCRNPMVGRPQPMTPKVWDRIKHPLVRMLEDFKAERKAREFKQTLSGRKRFSLVVLRRFQNAWLSDLTVVNFQRSSLLVQSFIRSTFPVTIDDSYFAESAQDLLGGLLDEWRQTVQNYLLDQLACPPRIRDTFALGEYNSDWKTSESISQALYLRLPLATTVFLCECSSDYWKTSSPTSALKPLFYPQVLGHICHTRAPALDLKDKTASSLILAAFRSSQGYPAPQAWDCSSLRLNTLLGEMVQRILQSAHLDPEVTTAQYMDGLDVYFACMTCAVQDEDEMELYETEALGWKDAVSCMRFTDVARSYFLSFVTNIWCTYRRNRM
ncbi:hypothetical protein C8R43DRAFT_1123715 [Mycena crocata]|nr:hypothetical protein C8R43DRAFT_1123715 [Mycena crocata]